MKQLTGLPINYLITVNFRGFIQIVDRVGGVWIDVDRRYYNRNVGTAATNFSNINLRPGYQRLKGGDALAYVRYRHTDSDLYRLARQQQFVKALKEQISSNFSVFKRSKVVGAITHNVEIGQAGGGSLENTIRRYALFAYGLPSGHFFQTKIDDLQGGTRSARRPASIQTAVHDFETPDVEAPRNGAAVSFGRKAAGAKALPPSRISISVLNGNGVTGSASNAAYELVQRGYQIAYAGELAPTRTRRTSRTSTRRSTTTRGRQDAKLAARKVANLFGDADVGDSCPRRSREGAARAGHRRRRLDVPRDARAGAGRQDAEEAACVGALDPGQTLSTAQERAQEGRLPARWCRRVSSGSSYIDREVPIRVYSSTKGEQRRAARRSSTGSELRLLGHRGDDVERRAGAPAAELQARDQGPRVRLLLHGRTCTWSSCDAEGELLGRQHARSTCSRTRP